MSEPCETAILVVNGGADPPSGRWLRVCLESVRRHTARAGVRVFVWNNNVDDPEIPGIVRSLPGSVLVQADRSEKLGHPHAVPLQRLWDRARCSHPRFVVTLDSDAFPVRDGWLDEMIAALESGAGVAAVWRDELDPVVDPYAHPSALAVSAASVEILNLRFDHLETKGPKFKDTLSSFTDRTLAAGGRIHRLTRSNRNEYHRLMGGVYGDLVYHHGAGSRADVRFWDERGLRPEQRALLEAENEAIRNESASLIFRDRDRYIAWLQGRGPGTTGVDNPGFLLVLGMHRSGTSCLAGCLERSGVFLGHVSRKNPWNARGNHELAKMVALQERVLVESGGAWDSPPLRLVVGADNRDSFRLIASALMQHRPCGFKDPRTLLMVEEWFGILGSCAMVGTYRHPAATTRSLQARNQLPTEKCLSLWLAYNSRLVRLHQEHRFPLIEFDLTDPDDYLLAVGSAAVHLGLSPDFTSLSEFVTKDLDHSGISEESTVPDECRETWDYLREHAWRAKAPEDDFDSAVACFLRRRAAWKRKTGLSVVRPTSTPAVPGASAPLWEGGEPKPSPSLVTRVIRRIRQWGRAGG